MQNERPEDPGRRRGRISVHRRGFGFVRTDVPGGDSATHQTSGAPTSAFVPPPSLEKFLDGDLVDATFVEERDGRLRAEELVLVERARDRLFGSVRVVRGRRRLEVDPEVASKPWPLEGAGKIPEGALVVAEVDGRKAVRPKRVPEDEASLRRVLVRWSLRDEHPGAVVGAAKRVRRRRGERRDLRDVPTVTIDAPTTFDIDDAVSVIAPAQADGSVRVLVSIADVDAYVEEDGAIDREARTRGTSVYLPDRVIPMIPRVLSEERASLLPGVDRAALTVELRIDPEGVVRSCDVFETIIKSNARLSYEAVAEFLDRGRQDAVPAEVSDLLRWLRAAAGRLSAVRASRGGLRINRDEARLTFDPATREPTGIEARRENSAHRLIERLMVAANESVACWLHERGLPALYRVHPSPEDSRVTDLTTVAANFGFETAFGGQLTPLAVSAFEAQFETSSSAPAIRGVLRRTLGPARYTVHPEPHFGLAAPLYLHFTSPIRRYADLVVHRIIKRHLRGDRDQTAGDPALEEVAVSLNELAYRAKKAESERMRMLTARLFAGRVGERFAGSIISVRPFGLIVQLDRMGVTGLIPIETLPGDDWRIDTGRHALTRGRGRRSRRFEVGAAVAVEVTAASEEEGQIDLALK